MKRWAITFAGILCLVCAGLLCGSLTFWLFAHRAMAPGGPAAAQVKTGRVEAEQVTADQAAADQVTADHIEAERGTAADEGAAASGEALNRGVENNGGKAVRYLGNEYYWKYNSKSVEDNGLFASYGFVESAENQMICRRPDGSEQVLFEARGSGDIYIAGDRMYLTQGYSRLFSVKMDGSGRIDYGIFEVWAADEEKGTLVGTSYERGGGIYILYGEENRVLRISGDSGVKAGVTGGDCYYSVADSATRGFFLYRLSADGTGGPQLVDHVAVGDPYDQVYAMEVIRLGDRLYYSYGFYGGTGRYFQQGGINSVNVDGSDARTCVEYGGITGEDFLVEKKGEAELVYYIDGDIISYIGYWKYYAVEGCQVKNMSTGQVRESDFPLSRQNSYIYKDGGILMVAEHEARYQTLISKQTAARFGLWEPSGTEADEMTLIRHLEVVGDIIYFTVERSERNPALDIGWRTNYMRTGSECYRMEKGGENPVLLYSY